MEELSDEEPKVLEKMKLGHIRPGISQVGEAVFVVGGVEKFREGRFIEFWEVSPLSCTKFGLQNNMNAAFIKRYFCES